MKQQNEGWSPGFIMLLVVLLFGVILGAWGTWGSTRIEYVDRVQIVENASIICKCNAFDGDQWVSPETCAKVQGDVYRCKIEG